MGEDLEKREDELEEAFARQLELFKAESEDWLKIAGLVLAGGLIALVIIKARKKRKDNTTERALSVLKREGLLNSDIESRLKQKSKSKFFPKLSERILILGLTFAKEKFLPNLFNAQSEGEQPQKESK